MESIKLPARLRVYMPLILLFVLLVFIMPRSARFSYDYKRGAVWQHETLIAQFDFPVLKTQEQYQQDKEKAGSRVIPYYKLDTREEEKSHLRLASMDFGTYSYIMPKVDEVLSSIYSQGVMSVEKDNSQGEGILMSDGAIYVQKDRRAFKVPVSEVYSMDNAHAVFKATLIKEFSDINMDSLYVAAGMATLLEPNLIYDQQTTDLVHKERYEQVSRTQGVMRAGLVIVSQGEIVTSEIEQLLDSYRLEYDANVGYAGPKALQWIGNVILALFLVLVLFLAIYYCNYRIFEEYNKYLYLLMVFTLSALASSWVAQHDSDYFYLMPFMLIVFYQLAFFSRRMVFSVYFISLLPMLIFAPNGMELFVIYLVAGTVAILTFERFNKGWLQFVTALIVFAVMVTVWLGFRFTEGVSHADYHTVIDMGLSALFSVAGYPLVYLFEKIFKLVSNSKLVELSDTSNPLLRMLADKAPGTFQHSLQVMNLADAAARSIDVNVPLVRAAALYHDIGKISNPQCFTENETHGVKYHAGLTPKESAQEIIRHVSDGVALADKHGLPEVLIDFIRTHHGTTPAAYFLNMYLNAGGDPEDVADFYYDGVKPTTKEHVLLMLCDAVEAASRSLSDYSEDKISSLVENIVGGKISDGQLTDADISLKEIAAVKKTMKTYLQQMYHSRISYPKRKRSQ